LTLPPGARGAVRVGGGNVNDAYSVVMADGRRAFVKTRASVAAGEYRAEAAGLRWLSEPGALRTPAVHAVHEQYLALQWIEQGQLSDAGAEELGRGLALTHAAGCPWFGAPPQARGDSAAGSAGEGGAPVARLGGLELPNDRCASWPEFYARCRLLPLARAARDGGAISPQGAGAVRSLCDRLEDLAGPAEPPARLHGDLWWGNVMADSRGRPWLIDPWAYGGHREVDLAMLALFGGGPARVLDAYREQGAAGRGLGAAREPLPAAGAAVARCAVRGLLRSVRAARGGALRRLSGPRAAERQAG
jgi:fructosamine-3-kinase